MKYVMNKHGKIVLFLSLLSLVLIPAYTFADTLDPLLCPTDVKKAACHHATEGIDHYKEGHWDVAAKHFSEAIKADPKFAEAHYNLALCYEQMDNHKKATEHFKMAAKLAPKNDKIQKSEILLKHIQ
ncbi:MAG: tetratricopeptide repeat protein [Nitrospinota bacterium]